ncbi:Uncharacterized conserved protein, DUF58 family, contains vWF domain [Evansella caseinilytica]|uniref:Uncharacterized conserved protein, DUF58 family, contains vWF domain n=1 Tax=Evansella caseinilytica TaxID=1503961 RepID=A0A1H3GRN1_9BACI|nr:DUF58 domain-containing protein [Evansella caseinilytica]SDY05992.1 Uncharacterized conserved protein, DUF58 family, contains vWF domain [Evansella caseinilytica]
MSGWKLQRQFTRRHSVLVFSLPFLTLTAIFTNEYVLFSFALFFVLLLTVNKWYLDYACSRITIPRGNEVKRIFPGELATLQLPIEYSGKVPIFSGKLSYFLYDTDGAVLLAAEERSSANLREEHRFSVPPLTKRVYDLQVKGVKRGTAQIRSLELVVHDIFQFSSIHLTYAGSYRSEVIVYPEIRSFHGLEKIIQQEQGAQPRSFSLYEDVMMTRGNRKYTTGDPFNRINWKASARAEQLQTKIYEKITVSMWTIVINVKSKLRTRQTIDFFEEALSQAAYTCQYAAKHDISFEIFVNIKMPGTMTGLHLPYGNGKHHLLRALELLARLRASNVTVPVENMLHAVFQQPVQQQCILHFGAYGEEEERKYSMERQDGKTIYYVQTTGDGVYLTMAGGRQHESAAT